MKYAAPNYIPVILKHLIMFVSCNLGDACLIHLRSFMNLWGYVYRNILMTIYMVCWKLITTGYRYFSFQFQELQKILLRKKN